jgi:hypothetical protein
MKGAYFSIADRSQGDSGVEHTGTGAHGHVDNLQMGSYKNRVRLSFMSGDIRV